MKFSIDETTVRLTNLPEEIEEEDLYEVFIRFGPVNRVVLFQDNTNNASDGSAFIKFNEEKDAQKAIECASEYGYGRLMLKDEWAKFVYSTLLAFRVLFLLFFSEP